MLPHHRALRAARAITLGLAVAGAGPIAGCEALQARYCEHFPETKRCCERAHGVWLEPGDTCVHIPIHSSFSPPPSRP